MNSYSIEELDDNLIIKANVAQKILVMVPKNHELKANIKLGIGDFYGENLNNVEIEINTGEVVGNNLSNVKKLQLDLGDLELNASKNIEKIELKTGSGKIELLEQDRDFTITNNLGDIDFSITNKFDGEISGKVKLGDTKINNLNSSGKKYKGNITVDLGELNITGINQRIKLGDDKDG